MENGETAPQTCFRVKSWCNRWLSVDLGHPTPRATFVEGRDSSCAILLLPRSDGRYMLQLLPDSPCFQSMSSRLQCRADLVLNGPAASHDLTSQKIHSWSRNRTVATDFDGKWFLGCRGQLVVASRSVSDCFNPNFLFTLEFDENGCVKFRGGHDNGYLSSDCRGRIWSGTLMARKWEIFQLQEEVLETTSTRSQWNNYAPVRVNLKAYTGKYVCAAKTVICAIAEAPCCCEELLLDMCFPPLPPVAWRSSSPLTMEFSGLESASRSPETWNYLPLESFETRKKFSIDNGDKVVHALKYMIRTADGRCNFTAEEDGMLSAIRADEVQGRELFNIELSSRKDDPKVRIRQCSHDNNTKHSLGYLSADPSGKLLFSKSHQGKHEEFGFELANSSRVLIRSVHGGFLGCKINAECTDRSAGHISASSRQSRDARMEEGGLRKQCACFLWNKRDAECVSAWRLIAHGDSLYTLVAVPTPGGGADVYLFVDARGRVLQSSEPGVHFPATASLFEIKATTAACLVGLKTCTAGGIDASIVGFTIRTVRKINGKQRFLSVEPNGSLKASRLSASRWEIFQFVDVDAAASASFPVEFPCLPASVSENALAVHDSVSYGTSGGQFVSLFMMGRQTRIDDAFGQPSALASQGASGANTLTTSLKLAAEVAADAVKQGYALPRRVPSTLQELCIRHICVQASKGAGVSKPPKSKWKKGVTDVQVCQSTALVTSEFANLAPVLVSLAQVGSLLPTTISPNETIEDHLDLPDDLLSRIKTQWRAKQRPQHSCKWLPSAFMAESGNSSHFLWNRGQPHLNFPQQAAWGNNGEGWHCSSCDHGGVLSMDPLVNPAHHRYLEVQYHAHSGVTQPTGLLWNIISFAGFSIMSTALFIQFFANAGRHSSRVSR